MSNPQPLAGDPGAKFIGGDVGSRAHLVEADFSVLQEEIECAAAHPKSFGRLSRPKCKRVHRDASVSTSRSTLGGSQPAENWVRGDGYLNYRFFLGLPTAERGSGMSSILAQRSTV